MDIVRFAAILVCIAFTFYALEKIPMPSKPPHIKLILEIVLVVAWLIMLWPFTGLHVPTTH